MHMIDPSILSDAVDIVKKYFDDESIPVEPGEIENIAYDWYSHIRFTNSALLAAAAIFGEYEPLTLTELEDLRDFYFTTPAIEKTVEPVIITSED